MPSNLSLSEALASLRTNLQAAQDRRDPNLPLKITGIELELAVEVTDQAGVEGGLNWLVVAKGSRSAAETQTHRLILTLEPGSVYADGTHGPFEVATSRPIPDDH
jgi:hypothetical protein